MTVSPALLQACYELASRLSHGALARTISRFDANGPGAALEGLSGEAAHSCQRLLATWRETESRLSSREVALVLSGAAHAVASDRQSRRVDLVWSGPDGIGSTFRSTGPALLELINSATQSFYLVAFAAYRVPEVAAAIRAAVVRQVRVVFVLETEGGVGGKVNFDPLPFLLPDGSLAVEVYHWPVERRKRDDRGRYGTLHAKFAVADRSRLLVSSANLTEYAFDLNIEMGVLLSGGSAPADAAAHVEEMIRRGTLERRPA